MLGDIARFLLLLMGWGGITYIIADYTYERGLERGLDASEGLSIEMVGAVLNYVSDEYDIPLEIELENKLTGEVHVLRGGHVDSDS